PALRVLSPIFFVLDPASTSIYTLSLHDALPIFHDRAERPVLQAIRHDDRDLDRDLGLQLADAVAGAGRAAAEAPWRPARRAHPRDRKSTRLNSSHVKISYAVFCLKKKKSA